MDASDPVFVSGKGTRWVDTQNIRRRLLTWARKEELAGPSRHARLLALAHHFDDMIREGVVKDQAEIARLCYVSRARAMQIMNLLFLAPDIHEEVLFSTAESKGGPVVSPKRVRRVVAETEWGRQRSLRSAQREDRER